MSSLMSPYHTKKVVAVRKVQGQKRVIDLTVEKNHTFVHSSGCVVHNCNTQGALRNFIESYSKNCRFILTANFKNRIIEPLHSRCSVIEFEAKQFKDPSLLKQMLDRLEFILQNESIEYSKKILAEIIFKWSPDYRRVINELQRYSINAGKIDSGILISGSAQLQQDTLVLVKSLKEKNFKNMRQWVADHTDTDSTEIFRKVFDIAPDILEPQSIPHLILILAEYGYRAAFVVDQEINTTAAMTEIMTKCKFL